MALKRIRDAGWFREAVGFGMAQYLRAVWKTSRFVFEPADLHERLSPELPVIITLWHGQHFMLPFMRRPEYRAKALISSHRDGALNAIAAEHLGELARRVTFVTRDFREPAWPDDLGTFDAVVTLQAAHETRHKRHLVPLLERARTVVAPGGVVLYADHYLTRYVFPDSDPLQLSRVQLALERAGFVDVQLRHEEGNMALWCGTNPVGPVVRSDHGDR